jgi:hypothetical protein
MKQTREGFEYDEATHQHIPVAPAAPSKPQKKD